MFKNIFHL